MKQRLMLMMIMLLSFRVGAHERSKQSIPVQPSSWMSTIIFYATPCYALSVLFDLIHNHSDGAFMMMKYINTFSSKMPQGLRAKMFKKALLTPSGTYENCYFSQRFSSIMYPGCASLADELHCLAINPDNKVEFETALKEFQYFYQCLIDAFNPRLVGKLSDTDKIHLLIRFEYLKEAEFLFKKHTTSDSNTEFEIACYTKMLDMISNLKNYAKKAFVDSDLEQVRVDYITRKISAWRHDLPDELQIDVAFFTMLASECRQNVENTHETVDSFYENV